MFRFIKVSIVLLFVALSSSFASPKSERFPADYFLVHTNLPHYMQVFQKFGDDPKLALSSEQKKQMQELMDKTLSVVIKNATIVRDLELALQKAVLFENKNSQQTKDLIEEILLLRTNLTITHIDCIEEAKKILTKEQDKLFLEELGYKQ